MTARPIHIPMARAQAHLAAGRYPQAIGAFRAVLGLDPSALDARLGMAEALKARGRCDEAVGGLVEVAESWVNADRHGEAMRLYLKALALDPSRMDLHLDMAFVEEAMGNHEAAVIRVEELADHYMTDGRTDEAAELLRFAATWGEDDEEQEVAPASEVAAQEEDEEEEWVYERPWAEQPPEVPQVAAPVATTTPAHNPGLDLPPINTVFISGETVIAPNPLLAQLLAESEERSSEPKPEPVQAVEVEPEPEPELELHELHELAPYESGAAMLEEVGELVARDADVTVARAPSRPVLVEAAPVQESIEDEPDVDMVTRIARAPLPPVEVEESVEDDALELVCESSPTAIPIKVVPQPEPEPEVETVARAVEILERPAPAYRPRPVMPQPPVASRHSGKLRLARAPRPSAAPKVPGRPPVSRRPAPSRPAPVVRRVTRPTAPNPLVDRLRARAGLGSLGAAPRATRVRATEAIANRSPIRMHAQREEEVTMRFRRPRGLDAAV